MVVGARTGAHVKIPLLRRPAKWFINKLANYLSGTISIFLGTGDGGFVPAPATLY